MAAGSILRLSVDHLGDLIALEEAAFAPVDRQSRRSLRYLLSRAHADAWGIVQDRRLVAAAIVLYRRGSRGARLYSIATDRTLRHKGLAARLLSHAERKARCRGFAAMRSEVRQNNRASQRLFETAGYRITGRRSGYYADGVDALRFEKVLGKALTGARHG